MLFTAWRRNVCGFEFCSDIGMTWEALQSTVRYRRCSAREEGILIYAGREPVLCVGLLVEDTGVVVKRRHHRWLRGRLNVSAKHLQYENASCKIRGLNCFGMALFEAEQNSKSERAVTEKRTN